MSGCEGYRALARFYDCLNSGIDYSGWADFLEGYGRLQQRGIRVCVHLIDGLPGETPEMMVESARRVAALRPHSVKLHLLHLVRGTALEKIYDAGDLRFLSREEYVKIVVY